jgi:hypothetical protein
MPQGSPTSPDLAAAGSVCGSLHRAYRDLRLYPSNHPMARQSIEGLAVTVTRYVDQWGSLTFEVHENALLVEGDTVYQHETSRDNLAFLLFRDGATLSLNQDTEIGRSRLCRSAHADDLADMGMTRHSSVGTRFSPSTTKWWIRSSRRSAGRGWSTLRAVLQRLDAAKPPVPSAGGQEQMDIGRIEPKRIDSAGLRLTPQEIRHGERAIEELSSVLQDFAEILLEIAGSAPLAATDQVLIQSDRRGRFS